MKLLLDECVDRRLASYLTGHFVRTVGEMGWAGIQNGRLLSLAQSEFEVFVTVDRNLSFQQHLPRFSIAVLLLMAPSNRLADLIEFVPAITDAVPAAVKGIVTSVLMKPAASR